MGLFKELVLGAIPVYGQIRLVSNINKTVQQGKQNAAEINAGTKAVLDTQAAAAQAEIDAAGATADNQKAGATLKYVLIGLGVIAVVITGIILFKKYRKKKIKPA